MFPDFSGPICHPPQLPWCCGTVPAFFIDGSAPPGCCQNSPLWVWEGPSARLRIVFKATPLLSHRLHKHRRNSGRQTSQSSRAVCFHAEATCCSHDAGKGRSPLLMLLLLSSSLSRARDPDLCQEAWGRVCVHSRVRRILEWWSCHQWSVIT